MEAAMRAVQQDEMTVSAVGKQHLVPRKTSDNQIRVVSSVVLTQVHLPSSLLNKRVRWQPIYFKWFNVASHSLQTWLGASHGQCLCVLAQRDGSMRKQGRGETFVKPP
jgi:hypothetical protein